ncbi:hypothetical protein CGRA01v4_15029 [Colletotrichum graminicola]|nr:hypothetical protein CGRA01v4_15029 [Colletotrichum graminicola]
MQADISHLLPLDQIAGFDAVWCTDNTITRGSNIHCALPWTSTTTVRPLEFPPQIRLVTPEMTPGIVAQPLEVVPTTINNPPGCVNPLRPSAIDQSDLAGDPGAMHENRQHCVKKRPHPTAAPCHDNTAARLLFENAPNPFSIVPTTAPSKPHYPLIPLQDQRSSRTLTATRASKAGGAAASCRKQHRMGKQKSKGKHKMTRASSARVTPYQQHVMELLTIIKRECPRD